MVIFKRLEQPNIQKAFMPISEKVKEPVLEEVIWKSSRDAIPGDLGAGPRPTEAPHPPVLGMWVLPTTFAVGATPRMQP